MSLTVIATQHSLSLSLGPRSYLCQALAKTYTVIVTISSRPTHLAVLAGNQRCSPRPHLSLLNHKQMSSPLGCMIQRSLRKVKQSNYSMNVHVTLKLEKEKHSRLKTDIQLADRVYWLLCCQPVPQRPCSFAMQYGRRIGDLECAVVCYNNLQLVVADYTSCKL